MADGMNSSPEVSIDLQRAVAELSAEDQELIFLRFVNEVPVNDIGKILNISRFSVRRRIQSCLKRLKTSLGEDF